MLAAGLLLPPLLLVVPLDRLVRRLGRPGGVKRPDVSQQGEIIGAVDRMLSRLPPPWRKTCLTRSIVLFHLFRRSGIPVELVVGVRREDEAFGAHAWLVRAGVPGAGSEPAESAGYEIIARFEGDEPGKMGKR